MERISLFKLSGLPDAFGVIVLVFSFILLLSPYLAGSDFGVFKVPAFSVSARKYLTIIGPAVFFFAIVAYLPIFPAGGAALKESLAANPELKPLLSGTNTFFFEGFNEGKLSGWTVLEADQNNWTIQSKPSSLLIVTQKGSIWGGAKDLKNQMRLDRELPKTDFEIIVKANFQLQGVGNELSVAIFKDDDNFMAIGYSAEMDLGHIQRLVHFVKEESGKDNPIPPQLHGTEADDRPATFYLKIERRGHEFTGYYSFVENRPPDNIDDIRWSKMGTHAWINFDGRLSLWATNSYRDPPQSPARFDFVLIRSLTR